MEFLNLFRAARRASAPLIAVRTADPAQTERGITDTYTQDPILSWDICRGCQWVNQAGFAVVWRLLLDKGEYETVPKSAVEFESVREELMLKTANLPELLGRANRFPSRTVLFIQNAQMYFRKEDVVQGIWNLRDTFKANGRTLVLLGTPGMTLPAELAQDTVILDEPLPSTAELAGIVKAQFEAAGADEPDEKTLNRAVDAVCGLAAFPAEQCVAMSFHRRGEAIELDTEAVWERKRKMVENAKGLSVWRGGETFAEVGGVETIKTFLTDLIRGEDPPRLLVLLDEFEKAMAGSEGSDTSGTAQEMHGTLLSEMEDREYTGLIFIGVAGSSKSHLVKCAGATFGTPVVSMQISQMKEKYVGSSNENLVQALAAIRAISQGRALFIATCNGMVNLSGPLKRRFNLGTWMFDLPTAEERLKIWPIHLKRWRLTEKNYELPPDDGWTGAEIRNCCMVAWKTRRSLVEASMFVTPQVRIDAENIDKLRQQANGRYLSASVPGFYQYSRTAAATVTAMAGNGLRRTISVDEVVGSGRDGR